MPLSKQHRLRLKGKFSEETNPPARPVLVHLPEPFIEALDAYGKKNGTGRGRSILKLLEDVLDPPAPPESVPRALKDQVQLKLVRRSDPLYKYFRSNHYIPDKGVVGQQLQYLVFYAGEVVGVIGGSSAVFSNQARDEYFNLDSDTAIKSKQLNSIINNNIFKLNYPAPNLATIVLSLWRKQIAVDWQELYGVEVAGFETFVVEERLWNGKTRNGACYRAENWELVGITKGYGETNVRGRKSKEKSLQAKKLVYCRRIKGKKLCTEYQTSWNDPEKTKEMSIKRSVMMTDSLDLLLDSIR